jgi:hypothetical protein
MFCDRIRQKLTIGLLQSMRKNILIIGYMAVLIALISMLFLSACEPEAKVTFINQQSQDIKIFVANVHENGSIGKLTEYGTISAHTSKTIYITFLGTEWINRIEIHNQNGNIIFSHDYKVAELENINWKITIPE